MSTRLVFLISAVCIASTSMSQDTTCNSREFGRVGFKINSSTLTAVQRTKLDTLLTTIKSHPTCLIFARGYSADMCGKCGGMSLHRLKTVISYLMKKGVDANRILCDTELTGNTDFVTLAFMEGPLVNPSEPPPRLKRSK